MAGGAGLEAVSASIDSSSFPASIYRYDKKMKDRLRDPVTYNTEPRNLSFNFFDRSVPPPPFTPPPKVV